jgi:hypothetical protein
LVTRETAKAIRERVDDDDDKLNSKTLLSSKLDNGIFDIRFFVLRKVYMNNNENLEVVTVSKVFDKDFTIYGTIDNPLFLAKDVAEWIEYDTAQVGKMIQTVDDDEKLPVKLLRAGQMREMWFLTENGLYEVLM